MKGIFAKGVITETFTPLTLAEFLETRVTVRLYSHLNLIDLSYKDSLMVKDITERVTHHVCDILASINPQDMGINLEEENEEERLRSVAYNVASELNSSAFPISDEYFKNAFNKALKTLQQEKKDERQP